jgi:hypothetical protein
MVMQVMQVLQVIFGVLNLTLLLVNSVLLYQIVLVIRTPKWQGSCMTDNWLGPVRDNQYEAQNDCNAHLAANPGHVVTMVQGSGSWNYV